MTDDSTANEVPESVYEPVAIIGMGKTAVTRSILSE